MPSLPLDFTATYELMGEDIPKGTKAVVYNLLTKKKMRVDTSDPSGVVVTYYMFFNQPEGITTSYTTYLSSCKKDTLQYHEGEELYLLPGHGPGNFTSVQLFFFLFLTLWLSRLRVTFLPWSFKGQWKSTVFNRQNLFPPLCYPTIDCSVDKIVGASMPSGAVSTLF